jgi:predicted porin
MKKSLLALAALTAFAGAASAQSSVTLFGIVDAGVARLSGGGKTKIGMTNSGYNSSRFGVRGVEDMGGGMQAGFWLEGQLTNDDGNAAGLNFQRRSTVSLMGGFGEIRMGRDYTPTFWNTTVYDPFGTNGVGQVQLALGEGAVGNEYMGGRIGYAAGPVNVAVAYGETQDSVGTADLKAMNVGASFNMGFMTLFGQYHEYKAGSTKLVNYMAGLTVPLGAGTLKATYAMTNVKPIDRDATQIAVGYVYDLSKRTAVYVHASQIDNDAGLRFVAGGGGKTNGVGGFKSTGYEVGVRHSF